MNNELDESMQTSYFYTIFHQKFAVDTFHFFTIRFQVEENAAIKHFECYDMDVRMSIKIQFHVELMFSSYSF